MKSQLTLTWLKKTAKLLEIEKWNRDERKKGLNALIAAYFVCENISRDQGTPYINHPVEVAHILIKEIEIKNKDLIIVALLHDALEVNPVIARHLILSKLGARIYEMIWKLTKEHKYTKEISLFSTTNYHQKISELHPDLLLVKFADRLHNLRELKFSPNPKRFQDYMKSLNSFYLPLAKSRSNLSFELKKIYKLMLEELNMNV